MAPDDSEPAALTRSTATATRIHIHPRPSTLPVSPQPPATADWAEEEEESFPSSEEERTPDGGIQEFVGHPYRSARMNNGEVVTSEMTPPPQTMVGGHQLSISYRRQYSDNNRQLCERFRHEVQRVVRRQLSEPVEELHRQQHIDRDNNGRPRHTFPTDT